MKKRLTPQNFRLFKSRRGMTLTEVVVSLALLGLLTLFIITVFVTALNIVRNNAGYKISAGDAAGGIEHHIAGETEDPHTAVVSESGGSFVIDFGGNSIQAQGDYVKGKDMKDGITYHYFMPAD